MGEWQHDRQNGNPEGSMAAVGRDSRGPATQFSTSTPSYGTGYAEVLPPVPPPAAPERPRPRGRGWASAPATYTLVGINCAVYVAMVLNGVSPTDPKAEQLVHWGAAFGPYIIGGEWWRLVTAMFVHIGFWHLATNMWCLWNLGLLGEPLLGPVGLIGVYLLTGFAGNLLSLVVNPGIANHGAEAIIGAGASGAIFGIAGALILLLNSKFLPLAPADRKSLRKSVIWFAVLNFVLGAGVNLSHFSLKIDNSAHLGGFLEGLFLAITLVPRIGSPAALFRSRRNLSLAGHLLLLLLLCAGVRNYERAVVKAEYGVTLQ
jgi:rhomboid protease GluP